MAENAAAGDGPWFGPRGEGPRRAPGGVTWCRRIHCELAWLGGERAAADVVVDVDGERITGVRPDVPLPPPDAVRLPGLTLPGFANAHSHAFHRALRGRTHRGTGLVLDVAPADVRRRRHARPRPLLPAGPGDVRRDGAGRHRRRRRVPLPPPRARRRAVRRRRTRWPTPLVAAAARRRHPDHAARHLLPPRRAGRRARPGRSGASRTASPRRGRRGSPRCDRSRACGSAPPCTPCGPSTRRPSPSSPRGRRRGAVPLHAHVSEQPAENEQVLAAHGATPVEVLAAAGALDGRFTAVHATHVTPADIGLLGAAPAARAASARRPSATSPTASARRSPCATPAPASASAATRTP